MLAYMYAIYDVRQADMYVLVLPSNSYFVRRSIMREALTDKASDEDSALYCVSSIQHRMQEHFWGFSTTTLKSVARVVKSPGLYLLSLLMTSLLKGSRGGYSRNINPSCFRHCVSCLCRLLWVTWGRVRSVSDVNRVCGSSPPCRPSSSRVPGSQSHRRKNKRRAPRGWASWRPRRMRLDVLGQG